MGLFSAVVLSCTHVFNISTSDFNANLTAMEYVLNVLPHHSQIIAKTSINSCQIPYVRMIVKITRRSCKYLLVHILRKENYHLAWYVTISAATPLHCLAMTRLSKSQNLQKVENYIVIFNGNVLGHAWHTWCKKGTNGKRMSCSLLIWHIQILKLIKFRTMGLWKLITFFWYALYIKDRWKYFCHRYI